MKIIEQEVSIILPAYKERTNLAILIPEIEKGVGNNLLEIIVVDDSSNDGTKELIDDLNERSGKLKLITRPPLSGVGSAIRDGYNAATGKYILSADADLSLSVRDMLRLYQKIKEGFDMVVGYRYGPQGYYEKNNLSIKIKYFLSRPGSFLLRMLTGIKLRDFSNNSRIMRRDKWLKLKTYEKSNPFLFEVILKAAKSGFTISEVPISFYARKFGQSKINLWKEAPRSLAKLIKYALFDR